MWRHRRGKEEESRSSLIQEREGRCGRSLMHIDTPGEERGESREQGAGSREQGAGSREQGAGSREQGAGRREERGERETLWRHSYIHMVRDIRGGGD